MVSADASAIHNTLFNVITLYGKLLENERQMLTLAVQQNQELTKQVQELTKQNKEFREALHRAVGEERQQPIEIQQEMERRHGGRAKDGNGPG